MTPRWISRRTSWGDAPRIWIRQVFKCPYRDLGRRWGCYPWKRQTHAPIANTLYKNIIGQSMSLLPPGARRLDRGLVRRHRPMPEVFHSHRDHTDSDSLLSSETDAPGETLGANPVWCPLGYPPGDLQRINSDPWGYSGGYGMGLGVASNNPHGVRINSLEISRRIP